MEHCRSAWNDLCVIPACCVRTLQRCATHTPLRGLPVLQQVQVIGTTRGAHVIRGTSVSHAMGWQVQRATRAVIHGVTGS